MILEYKSKFRETPDQINTPEGTGFVKGKRSSGAFVISDIFGKVFSRSWNAKKDLERISARKNIIMGGMCFSYTTLKSCIFRSTFL